MRTVLFLIAFVALTKVRAQEPQIYWGESLDGFSVGLAVPHSPYTFEQPILVDVYLRNDTEAARPTIAIPARYLVSFTATDDARRPVPPKPEFGYDGSVTSKELGAGQMQKETIDLHDYLYLTNSGSFAVTMKRLLSSPNFALSGNAMLELVSTNAANTVSPVRNSGPNHNSTVPVKQDSAATNASSKDVSTTSKSSDAVATALPPVSVVSPLAETKSFTSTQKIGMGILVVLAFGLLAILWRALCRKPPP
jgi:hypothetical protein